MPVGTSIQQPLNGLGLLPRNGKHQRVRLHFLFVLRRIGVIHSVHWQAGCQTLLEQSQIFPNNGQLHDARHFTSC